MEKQQISDEQFLNIIRQAPREALIGALESILEKYPPESDSAARVQSCLDETRDATPEAWEAFCHSRDRATA